ncbi:hypothetical protein GBA52_016385 [Prunus armeniaca]|nr:hypothetical protein GBA52_016385 [Prunus armeniaca]
MSVFWAEVMMQGKWCYGGEWLGERVFTLDPDKSPLVFSPSKQQRDFTPSLGKPNDSSLSSLETKTRWNFKHLKMAQDMDHSPQVPNQVPD